jgi:prephenate dehydratase
MDAKLHTRYRLLSSSGGTEYYEHSVVVDECLSEELVNSLLSGRAEQAVMAIENSIAGPIIPNYALIDKHNLHIIGALPADSSKFDGTKDKQ